MARLFDGYGDYVHLTKEEIEAMASWYYGGVSWRDGAALGSKGVIGEPAFRGVIAKDRWTKVNERNRTYHFPNGATTSVDCTSWLWVSNSGTHYIKDSCGKIHIINKAWVRITITE